MRSKNKNCSYEFRLWPRYAFMDFLRSGFRQQKGNLHIDTSPGPVLESDRDRIKRILKSPAKSPHSFAPSKPTGADFINSKARNKKSHSTETLNIYITDCMLDAMDKKKISALILLSYFLFMRIVQYLGCKHQEITTCTELCQQDRNRDKEIRSRHPTLTSTQVATCRTDIIPKECCRDGIQMYKWPCTIVPTK